MKTLLALILTVVICGSIFAQGGDRVLADGNPPLMQSTVDHLIDFFEFGLHGKFTDAQRAQFQAERVAEWKTGDQKSRDDMRLILDMRAKLMALDDEKLKEAQTTLQNYLVDNIKKQPNDPTSKLLKEVYENGLRNAVSSNRISNNTSNDASILLGTWGTGTVSGINFVGQTTGSYTNGGGTQVMYTFKPGGRYEYASLTTSTLYNCSMKFGTYESGTVNIQGSVLTLIPQTSTFTSEDSCVARNNYKKQAGLERKTFNWNVERDEYGAKLCLQNATVNGCAYKR